MSINSLVSETAEGDYILTTKEAQNYDMQVLRRLAAECDTDAVSGRSTKLELISFFSTQRTLEDYANE